MDSHAKRGLLILGLELLLFSLYVFGSEGANYFRWRQNPVGVYQPTDWFRSDYRPRYIVPIYETDVRMVEFQAGVWTVCMREDTPSIRAEADALQYRANKRANIVETCPSVFHH